MDTNNYAIYIIRKVRILCALYYSTCMYSLYVVCVCMSLFHNGVTILSMVPWMLSASVTKPLLDTLHGTLAEQARY